MEAEPAGGNDCQSREERQKQRLPDSQRNRRIAEKPGEEGLDAVAQRPVVRVEIPVRELAGSDQLRSHQQQRIVVRMDAQAEQTDPRGGDDGDDGKRGQPSKRGT